MNWIQKIGVWLVGIGFLMIFAIIALALFSNVFIAPDIGTKIFSGIFGMIFVGLTLMIFDLIIQLSNT